MRKKIILGLFGMMAWAVGCREADDLPPNKEQDFSGDLQVQVYKPISGPGPNMLVHIYITEDYFNRRIPYASAKTDFHGIASFTKVPMGSWYVDCTVPADTILYDSATVGIISKTLSQVVLNLEPK